MRILVCQLLPLLLVCLVQASPFRPTRTQDEGLQSCGYESCPATRDDMLNVHVVCHTHDDVGWLKTVDQYYYGSSNDIQNAGVRYTINSVVNSLLEDESRKFIYVEMAFFWRWWKDQTEKRKEQVRTLVNNGQLEFINGGWVMNDEAAPNYVDMIDQMSWGFKFLKEEIGDCAVPKIGWQIDPFGHSREQASLFSQMGFDGFFFSRLDYQDIALRKEQLRMELMWSGSDNLGLKGSVFTGIMPNGYGPLDGFCFDALCEPFTPVMADRDLTENNVDSRVDQFILEIQSQAADYSTNNIMLTMGSDFEYQDANRWYTNLDTLIQYTNARQLNGSNVNVFYSTPSCYLQALNQYNQSWTVKTDDFFPYASNSDSYWTGYYTSRPAFKGYVKSSMNFLQVCKQLDSLAQLTDKDAGSLGEFRDAQYIAQHHDGVSGTEKQAVTYDYTARLSRGNALCQTRVNSAYQKLLPIDSSSTIPQQVFCNLLNVSRCDFTQTTSDFVVTVYNPLGQAVTSPVRLPIPTDIVYSVLGPDGIAVDSQIVPVPDAVVSQPERESTDPVNDFVFIAEDVPALGLKTYFVSRLLLDGDDTKDSQAKNSKISTHVPHLGADDVVMSNGILQVTVDGTTGLLKSITNTQAGNISLDISQEFLYYESYSSGAYLFTPDGTSATTVADAATNVTFVQGSVVQEVQQVFSDWVSQVIRLYANSSQVEMEWLVGPIPKRDYIGKEVITRYTTGIASNATFYTDSNGREVLQRIKDYRPTWNVDLSSEPVSGNYYPITSRVYIKDQDVQFTVLNDRAQGGSSLNDGEIELMLHRRLFEDDGLGVGEALNEPGFDGKGLVARGKHYLQFNPVSVAAVQHRQLAQRILYSPSVSFAENSLSSDAYNQLYLSQFTGLQTVLPDNVHLLTLEKWTNTSYLLRLEHFYEATDDPTDLSLPASVDLTTLFAPFTITTATEKSLGANIDYSEMSQLQWTLDTDIAQGPSNDLGADLVVELSPMQIRTFYITVA